MIICTIPYVLAQNFIKTVCKHIVGLFIRSGKLLLPVHVFSWPLGVKRKKGRPRRCGGALLLD